MTDVNGVWIPPDEDGNDDRVHVDLKSALRAIGQFVCGCSGHDALLSFGRNKLYLECSHCGWRSDGIAVGPRR